MSNKSTKEPFVIWFTGLSGSGKTTLAKELKKELDKFKIKTEIVDGDEIRKTISKDLGFSKRDIAENHRRILKLCKDHTSNGRGVITATISPHQGTRAKARKQFDNFIEVFCSCPIEECAKRDPKGLYKKVKKGEIKNFIGIKINYERPEKPEIILHTHKETVKKSLGKLIKFLKKNKYI